jgi:hypothetical protein
MDVTYVILSYFGEIAIFRSCQTCW